LEHRSNRSRKQASSAQQGLENLVRERPGEDESHNVSELGDHADRPPHPSLLLVGYGRADDDLGPGIAQSERGEKDEAGH